MGSAPSRKFPDGVLVMVDISKSGGFSGSILFGQVKGACAALTRNNFEYTIAVDDNCMECIEEQFIQPLKIEDLPWVSETCREVAVWVETHGENLFLGELVRRNEDLMFEVVFFADSTVLKAVHPDHLSMPDEKTIRNYSPQSMPADPLWLLDRKIQANIDKFWPLQARIEDMLRLLQVPRPGSQTPLGGPFVGNGLKDSEGFASHPSPPVDLVVDAFFVDTWAKYAGKIKFADTFKIGPSYPQSLPWVETIDAADPLYFHAALPVYAGLICIGNFPDKIGRPEWIRATDVCLVGIALYVNGELVPGFVDPPIEKDGMEKYGHDSCHFIPGCVATYLGDARWVGAVFCLAPAPADKEIRDDIYGILAYHQLLLESYQRLGETEITLEVNLVLTTNYLASARQVCAGAVRVALSEKALVLSDLRLRDIQENKLNSTAALNPRRARKILSERTHEESIDKQLGFNNSQEQPSSLMSPSRSSPRSPQEKLPVGIADSRYGQRGGASSTSPRPSPPQSGKNISLPEAAIPNKGAGTGLT